MESLGSKSMPDIEEMLEHLAMQKAWAEGRHEGRNEVLGETLLRLTEKKFGTTSADVRERLARAPPGDINRWFDRLLDSSSLGELFGNSDG